MIQTIERVNLASRFAEVTPDDIKRIARRQQAQFFLLCGEIEQTLNADEFKALYPLHWRGVFCAKGNFAIIRESNTWIQILES